MVDMTLIGLALVPVELIDRPILIPLLGSGWEVQLVLFESPGFILGFNVYAIFALTIHHPIETLNLHTFLFFILITDIN